MSQAAICMQKRLPPSRLIDAHDASIYSGGIINMYCRARSSPATAARTRGMSLKQFIDANKLSRSVRVYRDVTLQVDVPEMIDLRDETSGHYRFTLATQSRNWYRDFVAEINEVLPLHTDFSIEYVDPRSGKKVNMHELRPFDILFDTDRRAVLSVGSDAQPRLMVRKKPKKSTKALAARRAAQAALAEAAKRPAIDEQTVRETYNSAAKAAIDDVVRELLKTNLAGQARLLNPKKGSVALRLIVLRNFGSAEHYPNIAGSNDDNGDAAKSSSAQSNVFSVTRPSVLAGDNDAAAAATNADSRNVADHLSPSAERFWKAVGFMAVTSDIAELVTKFTKSLRNCCHDAIKRDEQQWLATPTAVRREFYAALRTPRSTSDGQSSTPGSELKAFIDEKRAKVHALRDRLANVTTREVTYADDGSYVLEEERRHVDSKGNEFTAYHRERHAADVPEKALATTASKLTGASEEDETSDARLRAPKQLSVEGSDEELVNIDSDDDDDSDSSSDAGDSEVDEFGCRRRRRCRRERRRRAHSNECDPCGQRKTTIADRLGQVARQTRGQLSVLIQLADDNDLIGALSTLENITLFAPVNEAFGAVDTSGFSKDDVKRLLKFHVVTDPIGDTSKAQSAEEKAEIVESALLDLAEAGSKVNTAAEGAQLSIETADRNQFEEATLVLNGQKVSLRSNPILADNGTIWVIDTVLVPKGSAPTAAAAAATTKPAATPAAPQPTTPARPAAPAVPAGDAGGDDTDTDTDGEEFAYNTRSKTTATTMFAAPTAKEQEMLATASRNFDRPPRLVPYGTQAHGGVVSGESASMSAGRSFADYAAAAAEPIADALPAMPALQKIPKTATAAAAVDEVRRIADDADVIPPMPALRKINYSDRDAATVKIDDDDDDDERVVAAPADDEMPALKPLAAKKSVELAAAAAAAAAQPAKKSFAQLLAERKANESTAAPAKPELSDSANDYKNFLYHFNEYMAKYGDAEHMRYGAIVFPPTSDVYSSQVYTALSERLDDKQMRKNIEQYIVLAPAGGKPKIDLSNGPKTLRTMGGHELIITKGQGRTKKLSNMPNTELLKATMSKTHAKVFFVPQRNLFKPGQAKAAE